MNEEDINLENQRLVYNYILNNPGVHLRKISRELNIHLSTLRYHVNFLEKKGLIISKNEENLKIYFVIEKLSVKDKKLASLLQQKRFRHVIITIIITPGLTHSEISHKLSVKPSTLSKYTSILEKRGIISHEKDGREKHYYVSDEKSIMELLLTYKKSFWDSLVDNALELYYER